MHYFGISYPEMMHFFTKQQNFTGQSYQNLSFYHVNNNTVFIAGVLNGRTDYMNILFRK